jgi:cytochrome P450
MLMSPTKTADRFFIEAMTPESRENPYPLYASYLERGPIIPLGNIGWLGFGYGVAHDLLRRQGLSSDGTRSASFAQLEAADPEVAAAARIRRKASLIFLDPPDHTRLRRLISRAFTPRVVTKLRADIEAIVTELMADLSPRLRDGETVDLMSALANPLPVRVICQLLGVPYADEAKLAAWSDDISLNLDPSVLTTPEVDKVVMVAKAELADYLDEIIERHRRDPGDDLLSALAMVEADGEDITRTELVDLAGLLLIAGHLTTTSVIGNGMLALLQHQEQLDLLHSKPELIDSAVDELLRWDPPVQLSIRIATEPLDVADVHVCAGQTLLLVLGAANRDPEVFADPHTLDITRDARRHLSFGGGIHYCLGHTLARAEAQTAIGALVGQFPGLRQASDHVRRPHYAMRGLERLPVSISG